MGNKKVTPRVKRTACQVSTSNDVNEPIVLLEGMARALEANYNVCLPVPELRLQNGGVNVKKGKEFSVGLLETTVGHEWQSEGYRKLGLKERLSIAGSLFLWRKTLPATGVSYNIHRNRVTAPELELPPGYLRHVVKMTLEMFPRGWDHKYVSAVENSVPTVKSCRERGRGKGGFRGTGPDRFEFGEACMGMSRVEDQDLVVKYMDAECDGKVRAVTIMSSNCQRFKPLHKLLYDQISSFPWLLRGKAKPKSFSSFKKVSGEVFVSGDYESASDHLPLSVAEMILRTAFRRARYIPEELQQDALKFLRVGIEYPDGEVVESTRQLMGSLLCFPLLCLQNYIAFRYCFGSDVPVKVNGDDIVFRSSREEYEKWASFVGRVGLVLSRGKTLVSESFFSLNSTFFHAKGDKQPRLVPVIRCCTLMKGKTPFPSSLAGAYRGFVEGWRGESKDRLGAWFLRVKGGMIRKCGRSVLVGLGIPVSWKVLSMSGFLNRELWYSNSIPRKVTAVGGTPVEGIELPQAPDRLTGQVECPTGWALRPQAATKKERRKEKEEEKLFWESLIDNSWGKEYTPKVLLKKFWNEVIGTGYEREWIRWKSTRNIARTKPLFRSFDKPRSRLPSSTLRCDLSRGHVRVRKVWKRVVEREVELYVPNEPYELTFEAPSEMTLHSTSTSRKLIALDAAYWREEMSALCFLQ
ncbi:RNA-dependent RNA polymerase [Botrytis cinerea ourmia-like virus 8]|uniref:RNA-dependent RNA polymerase n=1 Tax=Botrytis cinerea ourmia-like virus 8 TaxID=2735958 RepID=A0A858YB78_9VIRU|nr:RNA-dependent RNA polymerase [Botrytis cinerea ourmia-like virus 8]